MELEAGSKVKEKVFSVSEYLEFLNNILKNLSVTIRGEIGEKLSEYPRYTFFNLLEKKAVLQCFVYKEAIESAGVVLEGGMEIMVKGYPEIYEKTGSLNFQVEKIELVGEGMLKKQFEVLKKRLSASGYFEDKYKKPIPRFPEKIGLITSAYGKGAKKDFLTRLGNLGFNIMFYDSRVEGIFALNEIVEAITWFNQNLPNMDAIVLTRGGGNWESLRPFNSEEIVKAIFASKIPVITGIGHENDNTLADYVADIRASTPTHAAVVLTDGWKKSVIFIGGVEKTFSSLINKTFLDVKERIYLFENYFISKIKKEINIQSENLKNIIKDLNNSFQNYFRKFEFLQREFVKNVSRINISLNTKREKVKDLSDSLISNNERWLENKKTILKYQEEKLLISSPQLKLKQGYSITSDEEGIIIRQLNKLKASQNILTRFYKGTVLSEIREIKK